MVMIGIDPHKRSHTAVAITRFRSPEALCSWAGLTPRHRESDTKVVRGKITKQGSNPKRARNRHDAHHHGASTN
jgi:transposase